jgi:hypothetical protein
MDAYPRTSCKNVYAKIGFEISFFEIKIIRWFWRRKVKIHKYINRQNQSTTGKL